MPAEDPPDDYPELTDRQIIGRALRRIASLERDVAVLKAINYVQVALLIVVLAAAVTGMLHH